MRHVASGGCGFVYFVCFCWFFLNKLAATGWPWQNPVMARLPLSQTPVKRAVYGALLISTIVGVLHVFACWFSVAPHGSDILYNKISGMLLIYLFLVVLYNIVRITLARHSNLGV